MDSTNAERVGAGYEAFARYGVDAIIELLDPEIEVAPIEEVPGRRTYRGHEGFRSYMAEIRELFGDFGWEATELTEVGNSVVARTRFYAEGRESGVPVEAIVFIVWTLRDGKAIRARGYLDRDQALKAAELEG
jgi:ketosteroid isomerase-like protein